MRSIFNIFAANGLKSWREDVQLYASAPEPHRPIQLQPFVNGRDGHAHVQERFVELIIEFLDSVGFAIMAPEWAPMAFLDDVAIAKIRGY